MLTNCNCVVRSAAKSERLQKIHNTEYDFLQPVSKIQSIA